MFDEIGTAIKTSSDLLLHWKIENLFRSTQINTVYHFYHSFITLFLRLFNLYSIFLLQNYLKKILFLFNKLLTHLKTLLFILMTNRLAKKIIQNHMNSAQKAFIDY
jgi:membrane protein required for beta-lactamase induction